MYINLPFVYEYITSVNFFYLIFLSNGLIRTSILQYNINSHFNNQSGGTVDRKLNERERVSGIGLGSGSLRDFGTVLEERMKISFKKQVICMVLARCGATVWGTKNITRIKEEGK